MYAPLRSTQWKEKRQWPQIAVNETPDGCKEKIFPNTDTGTGCTEQLWNLHPWRSSKFLQAKGPEEPAGLGFRLVLLCLQDSVTHGTS